MVPVIFVLVGLRLVQQHGHALHQSEQDRLQLEQRVREATAEIEHNFRQLAELRVEQIHDYGADPRMKESQGPMKATMEPAE